MNPLNDIESINFLDDYLIIKLELDSNKTVKNIYINNNPEPVIFNLDYDKYLFLNFSPLLTTNYIIKKNNKFKLLIISLNDWNPESYLFGKKPDKKYIIEKIKYIEKFKHYAVTHIFLALLVKGFF